MRLAKLKAMWPAVAELGPLGNNIAELRNKENIWMVLQPKPLSVCKQRARVL